MRKYSDPLLFAVLVFEEYFWNVTPANIEGRLYYKHKNEHISEQIQMDSVMRCEATSY